MSIKSEKAKYYIATKEEQRIKMRLGYIPMHDHSLEHLTELAESDAEQRCRERAARAFKKNCQNPPGQKPTECKLCVWWVGRECALFNQFLKYYDNE